jgi:hypothetical protein
MEERNFVVCMPVKDMGEYRAVAGSVQLPCVECGQMIWVAPSSVRILDKADPVCVPCVASLTAAANPADTYEFRMAPGALEEWEEYERENGL